jgi:fibronectin-binding autotransporter adhesin
MTNKRLHPCVIALAAFLAVTPLAADATVFFSDTFTNGSTVSSLSPSAPTATNAAYQEISSKAWAPNPPTIGTGGLQFGFVSTGAGSGEIQALFATNAIALVETGDNIQLAIVFTNTSGICTVSGQLGIGLYNSAGQNQPLPGGTNNAVSSIIISGGYVRDWVGYMAILGGPANSSRIFTRPAQPTDAGNSQDLVCNGSSSQAYLNAATIGSIYGGITLSAGAGYTEVFSITKVDASTLGITNTIYDGVGTGGTILTNYGGTATGGTKLTESFDGLAIGYRARASGASNTFNITSIEVSGSVTTVSGPPTIDQQPVNVTVATNGSCYFEVKATGFSMTYQWYRNGAVLANSGNISGATSSMLVVDNANVADAFSGANGYYCVITGAGNYSTNSTTNSLTLVAKKNLEWNGTGSTWDFANTFWNDVGNGNNPATFNFGDAVTFNDTGAGNANVTLNDKFLSASKWLISGSTAYAFDGSGYMAGAGQLVFNSSAVAIQMLGTNAHTGGTVISNDNASMLLYFSKFGALGSGPLTLAKPGSLEIVQSGGASTGIAGDVVVNDDFTIQFDGSGAFAGVFLGNLSGSVGKTLTVTPSSANVNSSTNRYRIYGTNTTYNGNLVLNGNTTTMAIYDGTVLASYHGSGSQVYNGVISGPGGFVQRAGATTVLAGANTYSGGTFPTTGTIGFGSDTVGNVTSGPIGTGPLFVVPELPNTTGSGTVLAWGGARTIANPIQYPSGTNNQTLVVDGTNNLTFTGPVTLNGNDSQGSAQNRIFQVNNTGLTTISGVISDGGAGYGFTKSGTGVLALNNTETYTGTTVVNAGTLLVNGQIGSGAVTVTNATIGGSGTVGGAVTVQNRGAVAPGNQAIGTLTLSSSLTLLGGTTNFIEVNKQAATRDRVIATSIAYNGTLYATNLAGTLNAGDSFAIYTGTGSGNFTNISGSPGTGLAWDFNPTSGVLSVVAGMATNPTNITVSVSGSALTLAWPSDHLGWTLESNSVSLTATGSWFAVPNSTTTTNVTINFDASKTNVFYRLKL